MGDDGAAKAEEPLDSADELSAEAKGLWDAAYRTDDDAEGQRLSDRAEATESRADAIREEYTERTGIEFNSDGEPDPYVIGDGGIPARGPADLAAAGLDPTTMTKEQQSEALEELAEELAAERPEQQLDAEREYVGNVLEVDTSGLTADQLQELVDANKGEFELDYARETGEVGYIEQVLEIDASNLTFEELNALAHANKPTFDRQEQRALQGLEGAGDQALDLQIPEGMAGKIVRVEDGLPEQPGSDGASGGPGGRGDGSGSGGDDPAIGANEVGPDVVSPGHTSTDSPSAGDPAAAGTRTGGSNAPGSPPPSSGGADESAASPSTEQATTPPDASGSPSTPATATDESAPVATPSGSGGTGEVVDIVFTIQGGGDSDANLSADGRWFDEAGHEITDSETIGVLDGLHDSYVAGGGQPTDGLISEVEVAESTFEEMLAENGADATSAAGGDSQTASDPPDGAGSGSTGGDSSEAEGADTDDSSEGSDTGDETGDSSDDTDGSSDDAGGSSDDDSSSEDDSSDETGTEATDTEADTDGSSDAGGEADGSTEDRQPEDDVVRDISDTLNDPSFQIREAANRTGTINPDRMASELEESSTVPTMKGSASPGPDIVVNPGESELDIREADVEARLATSNHGLGAIDYGDDGPPDLSDGGGPPSGGSPDPVTAGGLSAVDEPAAFAAAPGVLDTGLDAELGELDAGLGELDTGLDDGFSSFDSGLGDVFSELESDLGVSDATLGLDPDAGADSGDGFADE